jgi:hypothetical protein
VDARYIERRRELESRFSSYTEKVNEREVIESPSRAYRLTLDYYSTGPNTWEYSRGRVSTTQDDRIIADIKRNYGLFWYSWITHGNGHEYLVCGEDYQGQTIVNLSTGEIRSYFPDAGYDGGGFCWTAAYASPDSQVLAIEGCYWACPYEVVFYDFSSPDDLPYKELSRVRDLGKCVGWKGNESFELTREVEARKSDGRLYEELSNEEQDLADRTPGALHTVEISMVVKRPFST